MIRLIFLFVVLGAGLFVGTQFSGQTRICTDLNSKQDHRNERDHFGDLRYRCASWSFPP